MKGKNYSEKEETDLKNALARAFDEGMKVTLKYVDSVVRTNAGKLRLVVTDYK